MFLWQSLECFVGPSLAVVLFLTLVQYIILNLLFHWVSSVFAPPGRPIDVFAICICMLFKFVFEQAFHGSRNGLCTMWSIDQYHWYFVSPMPFSRGWSCIVDSIGKYNVNGLNASSTLSGLCCTLEGCPNVQLSCIFALG
jgi:hypothetical protein